LARDLVPGQVDRGNSTDAETALAMHRTHCLLRGAFGRTLVLALLAPAVAQSPGLAPVGTFAVTSLVLDDYTTVHGVLVDVKVFRPVGLPVGTNAPVLLYSPGGGSGAGGVIASPSQHELLWTELASAGLTVLHLQNEAESAPGFNFWQMRGDVVMWALGNHAQFNLDFGTQLGAQSPALVAGWSLGAATVVQYVGADFGFGSYTDSRVRGALLFATPALNAYGNTISAAGLAQVTKPVFCVFGTNDMGQPGTFQPTQPPATSPRGQAVLAMLQGSSPLVVAACFQGANHFQYGSQPASPGSLNAQRIDYINDLAFAFVDRSLRGVSACGPFGNSGWVDPTLVAWSEQRCNPASTTFAGTGCPTALGVPTIGTTGGAPVSGNAAFGLTLGNTAMGSFFITAVAIDATLQTVGVVLPGSPNCASVYAPLSQSVLLFGVSDALGEAVVPLPLTPASPALWGVEVAVQHAVWDFANPAFAGLALPFGTSVGMQITVGS
jgi:hypothetical protein